MARRSCGSLLLAAILLGSGFSGADDAGIIPAARPRTFDCIAGFSALLQPRLEPDDLSGLTASLRHQIFPRALPMRVRARDVEILEQNALRWMNRHGASVQETMGMMRNQDFIFPYLRRKYDLGQINADEAAVRKARFIIIKKLPTPVADASAATPALLHPGFAALEKELQALNVEVVVDSSLSATGTKAYFLHSGNPEPGIIAITTDTSWELLQHEVFHVYWLRYLSSFIKIARKNLEGNPEAKIADFLPAEILNNINQELIPKLESMLHDGFPNLAINESLAVESQKITNKKSGIKPALKKHYFRYARKHQIFSILDRAAQSGELPERDGLLILRAWIEYIVGKEPVLTTAALEKIYARCYADGDCGEKAIAIARLRREAVAQERENEFRRDPSLFRKSLVGTPVEGKFSDIPAELY